MTVNIFEVLAKHDFTEYPSPSHRRGARCFEKRCLTGPECFCNEKTPLLHVVVYPDATLTNGMVVKSTVSFEVFGEDASGLWLNANIYSVSPEEFESKLPMVQEMASDVWKAFCREKEEE